MGRKQYRIDLQNTTHELPRHISDVRTTDDGEIAFEYSYEQDGASRMVTLGLISLNIDGYPFESDYILFTADDVDVSVSEALQNTASVISSMPLTTALPKISNRLHQSPHESAYTHDAQEGPAEEWYHELEDDDDNDDAFRLVLPKTSDQTRLVATKTLAAQVPAGQRQQITADLALAHEAGFKIGVLGDLTAVGVLCVSIRTSKLGISDEAMKAWNVRGSQYFVVLIRFLQGYKNLDYFIEAKADSAPPIEIKVGLCAEYKPSDRSAFSVFSESDQNGDAVPNRSYKSDSTDMQQLFIGKPIGELLKTKFALILRFRKLFHLGWFAAERMVHDKQGNHAQGGADLHKYQRMREVVKTTLPDIPRADCFAHSQDASCAQSLSLVTMQFALRHFVRCTEFCLVCHCMTGAKFEALKPYVCSNPLCLYQYMTLGFGPNVEWEILSQPYVVDLLISFCYAQARAGKLENFPDGMNLKVPILPYYVNATPTVLQKHKEQIGSSLEPSRALRVRYNAHKRELLLAANDETSIDLIRCDDWIAIAREDGISYVCHRVNSITLPSVELGPPLYIGNLCGAGPNLSRSDVFVQSGVFLFDRQFHELSRSYKQKAIVTLLDTLPSVKEMADFLRARNVNQDPTLWLWRDRVIGPALNVLRWIIASNRSCIMQVDQVLNLNSPNTMKPFEDRVSGMQDYMQFRFAQGAPDKEQRFLDCVEQYSSSKEYPTLFAWHGSALHNWHSIIREGLHFRDTVNGRAFGHGVYMSQQATISAGYSGNSCPGHAAGWPHSELKISRAISLNEIVNNPASFVHSQTHYVVDQIDWIQTRYLMIETNAPHTKDSGYGPVIAQDPARPLHGLSSTKAEIPLTAVPESQRLLAWSRISCGTTEHRLARLRGSDQVFDVDQDIVSIATMDEDRDWLTDRTDNHHHIVSFRDCNGGVELEMSGDSYGRSPSCKRPKLGSSPSTVIISGCLINSDLTDWMPGTLDMTNITTLPPPNDARFTASKTLMNAFKSVCSTQMTTIAHELGWYINPALTDNMYQWIFELHSFEKSLPLAQDMEVAGEHSIVIEMRFANDFPISPPFVRVIKPRFLPFNQGGGGHVTEGGAICMELLTTNGWLPANSIESTLLQIRLAICESERPARLTRKSARGFYGVAEAIEAYERACRAHGWKAPDAFATFRGR